MANLGIHVTAAEAAFLVHRHERIVRGHIKDQSLPARKQGKSWRIAVKDLELIPGWSVNRQRLSELELREARSADSLRAEIETLKRQISDLLTQFRLVETHRLLERVSTAAGTDLPASAPLPNATSLPSLDFSVTALSTEDTTLPPPIPLLSPTRESLPPGSVLARHFAKAHGVPTTTVVSQLDTAKVPFVSIDTGAANGRQERWLTPEQQASMISLWRRQGTRHTACPTCPHTIPFVSSLADLPAVLPPQPTKETP